MSRSLGYFNFVAVVPYVRWRLFLKFKSTQVEQNANRYYYRFQNRYTGINHGSRFYLVAIFACGNDLFIVMCIG